MAEAALQKHNLGAEHASLAPPTSHQQTQNFEVVPRSGPEHQEEEHVC